MKKTEYQEFRRQLSYQFARKLDKLAEVYLYSCYPPLNIGDQIFDPKGSGALYEIEEISGCSGCYGDNEPYWRYQVKILKGCKYSHSNVIKDGPKIKLRPVITSANTIEEIYKIAKRQAKTSKKLIEVVFVDNYHLNGIGLSTEEMLTKATDQELMNELERRKQLRENYVD